MTRTGLDHDWVASQALAMAHLESTGRGDDVRHLLERYDNAVTLYAAGRTPSVLPDPGVPALLGYADLADALVTLCGEPEPIPGYGVSFIDIHTGASIEPGDVTDDEPGRAVVWATQLAGCGVRGDHAMADAMVGALEHLPQIHAAYRLLCLLSGAGAALSTRYHIDRGDVRIIEVLNGTPALYRAECSDCGASLSYSNSRQMRDDAAAHHVMEASHTVRRWTE